VRGPNGHADPRVLCILSLDDLAGGGRNACLPGWLRSRRAAGSLMNPELGKALSTSRVKEHRRPLTGSAAFDGGTRPLREPVPPGSAAAQGSFGCV
jgi:hypothetical protein